MIQIYKTSFLERNWEFPDGFKNTHVTIRVSHKGMDKETLEKLQPAIKEFYRDLECYINILNLDNSPISEKYLTVDEFLKLIKEKE